MFLSTITTPVIQGRIPLGRRGTVATLTLARQLVRTGFPRYGIGPGATDLVVREKALEVLRRAGVAGHDFLGELRALFTYVRDGIRFTRDPVDAEWLQGPRYTITHGAGDCDDKSILLASMLRAIGNPAQLRFRVIAERGPEFSHVYVVARLGNRVIAMDPTWAGTPFGWQYPRPSAVGDFAL